jgi:hypothetical protein
MTAETRDEVRAVNETQIARTGQVEAARELIRGLPPWVAWELARWAYEHCAPDPFITLLSMEPDDLLYLVAEQLPPEDPDGNADARALRRAGWGVG